MGLPRDLDIPEVSVEVRTKEKGSLGVGGRRHQLETTKTRSRT